MYRLVGEIESNLKELKPDMGTEEAINYFRNIFIDAWKFLSLIHI